MGSVNRAEILGHIGRDAELRYTPTGKEVATFSVATSEKWTDKRTGETKERTEWHRCVLWGKAAKALTQYLVKGRQVYLDGKLTTRKWEKDGQKHYSTEILVDQVVLLGKSNGNGGARRDDPLTDDAGYTTPDSATGLTGYSDPGGDEEIPF
jgi:single-strand DNA-binding protein